MKSIDRAQGLQLPASTRAMSRDGQQAERGG